jgi:hypothetical protein
MHDLYLRNQPGNNDMGKRYPENIIVIGFIEE